MILGPGGFVDGGPSVELLRGTLGTAQRPLWRAGVRRQRVVSHVGGRGDGVEGERRLQAAQDTAVSTGNRTQGLVTGQAALL